MHSISNVNYDIYRKNNLKISKTSQIKYAFHFVSLITPHKITNVRLLNSKSNSSISKKHKKLFTKQSYLLMTWLWYIQKNHSETSKPSFSFKPTNVHKTTILKAPMAHKTFSQEQLQFKFFQLVISFKIPTPHNFKVLTVNQLLYLIISLKSSIPFVETNLFLLKRFQILLPSGDSKFLQL